MAKKLFDVSFILQLGLKNMLQALEVRKLCFKTLTFNNFLMFLDLDQISIISTDTFSPITLFSQLYLLTLLSLLISYLLFQALNWVA